ncbi:oligopeptide ABC transporter substrate-binding protein OppA, partial [Klebsiella pneumoniae]|nr:oligopeptide ABC transporter substrate-binding protein OppA [Klebsiella pneumoniae]
GPTADDPVRPALNMTIHRRVMAEKVLGAGETADWRFSPHVTAGSTPQPSPFASMHKAALNAQANALPAAAGYRPNRPLTLTLLYNTS